MVLQIDPIDDIWSTALVSNSIESDGSSLLPFDGEDRIWERVESLLDDIQRM